MVCDTSPALNQHFFNVLCLLGAAGPTSMRLSPSVGLMLSNRARRRPNIKPTLVQSLVFAVTPLHRAIPFFRGGVYNHDVEPMLFWYWPTVCDAGPAIKRHWVNASCLLWGLYAELFRSFMGGGWTNSRHWANVVSMLAHRQRRWPSIKQHWVNASCLCGGSCFFNTPS